MTARSEMAAAFEAILFVSGTPVPSARLIEIFADGERAEAELALQELIRCYETSGRGLLIEEVAGGLRLATRPESNAHLRRFFEVSGRTRLSMAAVETLAIVAYRQPVTAAEIQHLRGVHSGAVLRTLLERRLLRIAGRKQVVGKPFLYATTREFLAQFGLAGLEDLPPLEEFEQALGLDPETMDGEAAGGSVP